MGPPSAQTPGSVREKGRGWDRAGDGAVFLVRVVFNFWPRPPLFSFQSCWPQRRPTAVSRGLGQRLVLGEERWWELGDGEAA